jgi:alkyl hydroperoxide reductase subunit AhpF
VQEILGDKTLTGLKYKYRKQGEMEELSAGGVFVEIGSVPNSEFIRNLVETKEPGRSVIDHPPRKPQRKEFLPQEMSRMTRLNKIISLPVMG